MKVFNKNSGEIQTNILIGNTHIHRAGNVIEMKPGSVISATDALAVFHIIEHILFADQISVSTFETSKVNDRTIQILNIFREHGVSCGEDEDSIFKMESFTTEEYITESRNAAPGICSDLLLLTPKELSFCGEFADEKTRPDGAKVPNFNSWILNQAKTLLNDEERSRLINDRAHGDFELITLEFDLVKNTIRNLVNKSGRLTRKQSAALAVIFRLNINQQLANRLSGVYAPAPQRSRVALRNEQLFRHYIEHIIQDTIISKKDKITHEFLLQLMNLQALPLPLFAINLLVDSKARNIRDLIESARYLRDTKSVVNVRKWLQKWENKLKSPKKSWSAINELSKLRSELELIIDGNDNTLLSIFKPEVKLDIDPHFSTQSISLSLPSLKDAVRMLYRRVNNQHMFIATTAKHILSDARLGQKMISKLVMSIRLD